MQKTVVTIGTFDGVHRGHHVILRQVARLAAKEHLESIAYTFPTSPQQTTPRLLLPLSLKVKLLRKYVDQVKVVNFERIRRLSPGQFLEQILQGELRAQIIVVGEGFRFGLGRQGGLSLLKDWGKQQGLTVVDVPLLMVDSRPVSSTGIRELITAGEVMKARPLLGRPPILSGQVVQGDGLGQRIGYPTANLSIDPTVLIPAGGIYLVDAFWREEESAGLLYIGMRPSLRRERLRCEVHLLSPPVEELYGNRMEIHLLRHLRDDQAFPTLKALGEQIGRDIIKARSLIGEDDEPRRILP